MGLISIHAPQLLRSALEHGIGLIRFCDCALGARILNPAWLCQGRCRREEILRSLSLPIPFRLEWYSCLISVPAFDQKWASDLPCDFYTALDSRNEADRGVLATIIGKVCLCLGAILRAFRGGGGH